MTSRLNPLLQRGAENELQYVPPLSVSDYGSVKISRQEEITYGMINVVGDYLARTNDRYIISVGGSDSTITLPKSSPGKVYTFKNISGGVVTVDGGGVAIDASLSITISSVYNCTTVVFTGVLWAIVSEI